jgi:hypothetical protein
MRGALLVSVLLLSPLSAFAQTLNTLPGDLPSLIRILPQLVHTKQFQLDQYTNAVDAAMKQNPASIKDAIPLCAPNLRDPEPEVAGITLILLLTFVNKPGAVDLIQPLGPEIADIVASGDIRAQRAALGLIASLGPRAPDEVIPPLENRLQQHSDSEMMTVSIAQALIMARPHDDSAQSTVLNLINAPDTSRHLRIDLVYSALGAPGAGPAILDYLVQIINTSDDKELRDAAIEAAWHIGRPAVDPVRDRLRQIEKDLSESPESREQAAMALAIGAKENYPMVNGNPTPEN